MNLRPIEVSCPLEPRSPTCPIPLTAIQARIWKGSLRADGGRISLRLCATAVRIVGSINLALLQQSIDAIVRRHEALRTRIVVKDGRPQQQVDSDPAQPLLSVIDLLDKSLSPHTEVARLAQEYIDTPIDLAAGPLFEAKIWRLSNDEHVLVMLVDHIVSDGVSNGILTREVWECYRQGLLGLSGPIILPEIPVQFPDYAVWLGRTHLVWMAEHAEYWRQHLRDASASIIPADHNMRDDAAAVGITKLVEFGDQLTADLRQASRRERSLLSVFVLAAYAVVLSSWCAAEDLLVLFPSHGRHQPALRNMVGFVANMLLLRIHVNREKTFGELLAEVKGEIAAALEHRDYDRVPDFMPQCTTEVVFNWQSTHSKQGALDHHVVLECGHPLSRSFELGAGSQAERSGTSNPPKVLPFLARSPDTPKLVPVFFDTPSSVQMTVTFDPNVLAPATIESFIRSLLSVAREATEQPMPSVAALLRWVTVGKKPPEAEAVR